MRYFVSSSGRYVGIIEPDIMARDPRTIEDSTPEMVEQYASGDVWYAAIYTYSPAPIAGRAFRDGDEFASAFLGELIDLEGEQYGHENAKDMLLMQLEELDRRPR